MLIRLLIMGVNASKRNQKGKGKKASTIFSQSEYLSSPSPDLFNQVIKTSTNLCNEKTSGRNPAINNNFSTKVNHLENQMPDSEEKNKTIAFPAHSQTMKNEVLTKYNEFDETKKARERKSLITLIKYENKIMKTENERKSLETENELRSIQNNHFGGSFFMAGGIY